MRSALLASATVLAFAFAAPSFAQTVPNTPNGARPGNIPGTDNSLPTSNKASNIDRADTSSPIAPRLPAPGLVDGSSPADFLNAAKSALRRNRTGEAQEALERAETRMLDRSTPQGANPLDTNPRVQDIRSARDALASGDRERTVQIINQVLASLGAPAPSSM